VVGWEGAVWAVVLGEGSLGITLLVLRFRRKDETIV
jgi:hypothetical protein